MPAVSTGPLTITGWHSYDPNGDGTENDAALPNLHDGSGTTTWTTQCYADKFTGGKQGVGIVVDLKGGSGGTLDVVLGGAPWALELYATDQATIPVSFADWGAVGRQAGEQRPSERDVRDPSRGNPRAVAVPSASAGGVREVQRAEPLSGQHRRDHPDARRGLSE